MVIFHGYVRRWPGDVGHPSGSAGRACRSQKCGTIGKAKFRFQMIQMVPREMLLSMTFYLGNDHFDLNNWITIGHRIIVSNKKWALPPAGGLEAPKLSKPSYCDNGPWNLALRPGQWLVWAHIPWTGCSHPSASKQSKKNGPYHPNHQPFHFRNDCRGLHGWMILR